MERDAARDRYFVHWRGRCFETTLWFQRAWEWLMPKLTGGCMTSTEYGTPRSIKEILNDD